MMQVALKRVFFQRLLGMRAGRPFLSCQPTQSTKVGRRTAETTKRVIM
jgi:hypothetical protein